MSSATTTLALLVAALAGPAERPPSCAEEVRAIVDAAQSDAELRRAEARSASCGDSDAQARFYRIQILDLLADPASVQHHAGSYIDDVEGGRLVATDAAEAAAVQQLLQRANDRTTPISLEITGVARSEDIVVRLTAVNGAACAICQPLAAPLIQRQRSTFEARLRLPPDTWQIAVDACGEPLPPRQIVVGAATAGETITVAAGDACEPPKPPPPPPPHRTIDVPADRDPPAVPVPHRDRAATARIGVHAASGALALAGVGLVTGGALVQRGAWDREAQARQSCAGDPSCTEAAFSTAALRGRMSTSAYLLKAGAGLVGVGVGAAVTTLALERVARKRDTRRSALAALGVGGGLAIGGAVWLGLANRAIRAQLSEQCELAACGHYARPDDYQGEFRSAVAPNAVASALLGAGVGVITAAVVELAVRAAQRKRRAQEQP